MQNKLRTEEIQTENENLIHRFCNDRHRSAIVDDLSPAVAFARVPVYIWRSDYDAAETGLTAQAAGLYCHLMGAKETFANTEAYIHRKTGWSRSALSAALKNLEECGLVTRESRRIRGSYDALLLRVNSHPLRVYQQMMVRCLGGESVNVAFHAYMQNVVLPNMGLDPESPALPPLPERVYVESWDERLGRYVRLPCYLAESGVAPRLVAFIACLIQTHVEKGGLRLGAAAHAAGISRKTSADYAKLLRCRGLMVGYPNLYRGSEIQEDDYSPDGQARLFLEPAEISINLLTRTEENVTTDIYFWDRLRAKFGDLPGFKQPTLGIETSNPSPFDTQVQIENPTPFDTQADTFSSTNDEAYDNDASENPKSFAVQQRTSCPSSAGDGIINPLAATWECPQPELPTQAAQINAAYAATVEDRYGSRPIRPARYTQAESLRWCRSSRLVSTLMLLIGRRNGYLLSGKEAVLLRRRAVDGLLNPAMLDRLFCMRATSPLSGAVAAFSNRTLSGKKMRELDDMSRRHQADMLAVIPGFTTKVDGSAVEIWWGRFQELVNCTMIDAAGQLRRLSV